MATPPNKCLRGNVRITAAAAANLVTSVDVPIAIFMHASMIGAKADIAYQRLNGDWVEITRATASNAQYEHPLALMVNETAREAAVVNQMGVKAWNVMQFQKWANENIYNFFKDMVAAPATGTPSGDVVTGDNFIDVVNASLADHFVLIDTNGDGILEFHGK
jgi:hypothetical protein